MKLGIGRILVLAIVGLASIYGGYTGYNQYVLQGTKAASVQIQTATVVRGSLQATASASGNAVATNQQKVAFGTAGTLGELDVAVGDSVKAGQVLAKLGAQTVENLQSAVTQAQAALKVAQLTLDTTANPYTAADIAAAQQTVTQAQAAVAAAQSDLDNANAQAPLNLQLAQTAVTQAQTALDAAKQKLAAVQNDPTTNGNILDLQDQASYYVNAYNSANNQFKRGGISQDKLNQAYANMTTAQDKVTNAQATQAANVAAAQNAVAAAQDTLNQDQNKLAQLQTNGDPTVASKQSALASAQLALTNAQNNLATKQAGGDPRQVQIQQNNVNSAQAALDAANTKLQGAVITAPIDGIISAITPAVGDQVAVNAGIITVLDPNAMRMNGNVAETDIASIQIGQSVTITFDALPNQSFTGKVTNVAPTASVTSGVVNYPVSISLDKPAGVKDQMTASATIVTQQKDNILLVPNRAIKTQGQNKTVQVLLPDGTTQTSTIQIGFSGDTNTEVTSGLQEGDKVVIPTTTTTTRGVPGAGGVPGVGGGGGLFGGGGGRPGG